MAEYMGGMSPWLGLVARPPNMAGPLNTAIQTFLTNLEPTDRQTAVAAARQKAVRDRIAQQARFSIDRDFLHGSYARDTQIQPLQTLRTLITGNVKDIDAIVVLSADQLNLQTYWHINDGGALILRTIEWALRGFQGLTVTLDAPCVTVPWTDLKMEVAPAFPAQGGGVLIPASDGTRNWQVTDPEGDSAAITATNKLSNGQFIPLIKMLKCWNRNAGNPYRSFAIESILYRSVGAVWSGYAVEIPRFFQKAIEWAGTHIDPPSGKGGKIYLSNNPSLLRTLKMYQDSTSNAFALANQGQNVTAINIMGMVFGKPFPGAP